MCLVNIVKKVSAIFGRKKKEITAYKIIYMSDHRCESLIWGQSIKLGTEAKSNRQSKYLSNAERQYGSVHFGIHVYLSYAEALKVLLKRRTLEYVPNKEHVVAVRCQRSDYVAHDQDMKQAVFTKVHYEHNTKAEHEIMRKVILYFINHN